MAKKRRKSSGKMTEAMGTPALAMDDKWRAEDDLRTLERAHEVTRDSSRFSAAKAEAKRKRESLDRIARLDGKKL